MNYAKALIACAATGISATALFVLAQPAFGEPVYVVGRDDVITTRVSYADLNLAADAGQRTLNNRVDSAINNLCLEATGGNNGSTDFKFAMAHCTSQALRDARPQIAQAVQRAHEIAQSGGSSIVATALTISLPK
jgi:UrcA family protein